ncbi:MAG TPA: hypothetical protein VHB49_08985 [Bradyrhizobium sp.]|nr:hypothetical protein [Bradyrhizobium sp.]
MERHDPVILALRQAADQGVSATELKKAAGASSKISQLTAEGTIRGPIKIGRAKRYFLVEHAPDLHRIAGRIEQVLHGAGLKLTSLSKLEAIVKPILKTLFSDALSALKAEGRIVEVKDARRSKFYLHREPLLEQLRLEVPISEPSSETTKPASEVSLDQVRSIYEALKTQQGGISAVTISDVLKSLKADKAELHQLLLEEVKKGRVTLHRATTTNFPKEVIDAGISLEGEQHPFVTFAIR